MLNIEELKEDKLYLRYLNEMSEYRRKKIERSRQRGDRIRSLGVGILMDNYLKKIGLRERDMIYSIGENGKPRFDNQENIFFNASHSGSYAVCGFSDSEVGCDVEVMGDRNPKIAERFFAEGEKQYIFHSKNIQESFIRMWTIKESYLKCLGCGLTRELSSFEVRGLVENEISIKDSEENANYFFREYQVENAYICVCSGKNNFVDTVCKVNL